MAEFKEYAKVNGSLTKSRTTAPLSHAAEVEIEVMRNYWRSKGFQRRGNVLQRGDIEFSFDGAVWHGVEAGAREVCCAATLRRALTMVH